MENEGRKTEAAPAGAIHKFEAAGLGKAPFRLVGVSKNWFVACAGDPGKPGGSCDYCSTGIAFEYHIKSRDGKRFKVGSDCVLKVGDAGLKKVVNAAKNKMEREAKRARDTAKLDEALALLPSVEAKLAAKPHPRGFSNLNMLDWANWMLKNAGMTGRLVVAKAILAVAKEEG